MTTFRELLARTPTLNAKLPQQACVELALVRIQRDLNAVPKVPAERDLHEIQQHVLSLWRTKMSLEGLHCRTGRHVPWFLFRPLLPEKMPVGSDAKFVGEYSKWVREVQPRTAKTLYHVFLRDYPQGLPTFEKWRDAIAKLVKDAPTARLDVARVQISRFATLSSGAPKLASDVLLKPGSDVPALLSEMGLDGELRTGEFAVAVSRAALGRTQETLRKGNMEADGFARLRHLLEHPTGELVFGSLKVEIADALLLPFESSDPAAETKNLLQDFLLKHLRDPRLSAGGWQGVSPEARDVMLRWLVDRDLAFFFNVIGQTADPAHWKYRHAFWKAYLARGGITAAWVVLGPQAVGYVRWKYPQVLQSSGQLEAGVESNKSLLLMRIGDLIIAEWSHSGKCRVWREGLKSAPPLFARRYAPNAINSVTNSHELVHHGSQSYRWQDRLAMFIGHETGIKVKKSEYTVR